VSFQRLRSCLEGGTTRQRWARLAASVLCAALTTGVGVQARRQESGQSTHVFLGLGPAPDEAAAKRGEPLYGQICASCHGPEGRGAQAPSLIRSALVLHDVNGEQIGAVVRTGRPGSPGMPPLPGLTDSQIADIAQYIHLQVELTANRGTYEATYASLRSRPTGDLHRGAAFFTGAGGCTACHSATGDLADLGARFPDVATLKARFLWPTVPGPATATVTTADGQSTTGKIRRISDFEISLVDANGAYHYWPRRDVTVTIADPLAGHRALLPKYRDGDINDLAAYLETLK
jgi:mono/diheme cytochrome c family protein